MILALVALVCLLLGHRAIEGYLGDQRARKSTPLPELSGTAGVAGQVVFADGSPAAGARVNVMWRDSAGRPGTTPSVTDDSGRFAQANVPMRATITEVHAVLGPLFAKAEIGEAPREGVPGTRTRIAFPGEFKLAGLVRRAGDRAAIAGAALEAATRQATSGASGEFVLDAIPATLLREERPVLRITAAGYAPLEWPLPKDALPETYGDLTILMQATK